MLSQVDKVVVLSSFLAQVSLGVPLSLSVELKLLDRWTLG